MYVYYRNFKSNFLLQAVLYLFLTWRLFQHKSGLGINLCASPPIITVIKLGSKNEWGFRVLRAGVDTKYQGKEPLAKRTLTLDVSF
jgi:hypothetical protein